MTTTMSDHALRTSELVELENKYGAHNYHPLDVVIERADGVWVYDVDGKRYLDCLAAYSAVNQGHCHPKILRTLTEQAHKVTLTSRAFRNDQLPLLYKELHDLTGFDMALPMNSGAEAVETALKTARKWGYKVKGIPEDKAEIIVCANNFHGRTITIVSFSTDEQYRDGFGPFTPGFKMIPFGDVEGPARRHHAQHLRLPRRAHPGRGRHRHSANGIPEAGRRNLPQATAFFSWPTKFSPASAAPANSSPTCTRASRPMCSSSAKRSPEASIRFPPCLASREIMSVFKPGDHGSTFGGNPLGCAVARTALRVLVEEKLVERSAELGAYFLGLLRTLESPRSEGSPRQRNVDRHRTAQPGASLLRSVEGRRHPVQGNSRPRDSHRAAAGHHAGGNRLGLPAD